MSVTSSPSPSHRIAVLLVDVINDFDFPEGESLLAAAQKAAPRIAALLGRARAAGVPVIYVNDNFGRWRSDFRSTVARCSESSRPGAALVRELAPQTGDYFVLKPQHSGFFHTPLELMLHELRTEVVVICGFATNSCVSFTAHDAHMRGFRTIIPHDTTAANTPDVCAGALRQLEYTLRAVTADSSALDFAHFQGQLILDRS